MRRRRLPHHLLLQDWSAYAQSAELAEGTIQRYRYWLTRFYTESMVDLVEATAQDLADFIASLGAKGASRGQAKRAFRSFYPWAKAFGHRRDDPSEVLPRTKGRRRPAPDFFTEEELCQLVYTAAMWDEEWAWSFVWIFGIGSRVGEGCSAGPADVDLEAEMVTFRDTKNGSDRIVHLGPTARAAAAALMDGHATVTRVTPSAVRDRMKKIARMAGLPLEKVHPHTLRHTAGTLLSERGATQAEIMDFLGHVDPSMASWYVHVTSLRAKGTAERL